jgi:hypothetical protein
MARDGASTGREYRPQPAPLTCELPVSDRIDAAVEHKQPPRPDSVLYGASCDSGIEELSPADHSMLALRELRNHPINPTQLRFAMNIRVKSSCVVHW